MGAHAVAVRWILKVRTLSLNMKNLSNRLVSPFAECVYPQFNTRNMFECDLGDSVGEGNLPIDRAKMMKSNFGLIEALSSAIVPLQARSEVVLRRRA